VSSDWFVAKSKSLACSISSANTFSIACTDACSYSKSGTVTNSWW
jgi:hypothetical protein